MDEGTKKSGLVEGWYVIGAIRRAHLVEGDRIIDSTVCGRPLQGAGPVLAHQSVPHCKSCENMKKRPA